MVFEYFIPHLSSMFCSFYFDILELGCSTQSWISTYRIDVGNWFVHLDIDNSKPQNISQEYPKRNKPKINLLLRNLFNCNFN